MTTNLRTWLVVYRIVGVSGVESVVRSRTFLATASDVAARAVKETEANRYLSPLRCIEVLATTEEDSSPTV